MLTSFRVRGFRCFEDLSLDSLERVNLIAGKNGVGKTALLEALFLHCGPQNPMLVVKVHAFRGFESIKANLVRGGETPWDALFPAGSPTAVGSGPGQAIEISSSDTHGRQRMQRLTRVEDVSDLRGVPGLDEAVLAEISENSQPYPRVLRLEYFEDGRQVGEHFLVIAGPKQIKVTPPPPPAPFPARFLWARRPLAMKEMADRFGKVQKSGGQEPLTSILKIVQPGLRRVETVAVGGEPVLHGEVETGSLISLPEMGDGLVRLTELVLTMHVSRNGVVLVDEFEAGLHHGVLERLWAAVAEAARRLDVQIFATTHSWECITAAHRAFSDSGKYDLKLHRLERIKGVIKAVDYDQELVQAAIEMRMEVR